MQITKQIRIAKPAFLGKEKLLANINSVLESGRLMNGPFVKEFESTFSRYVNVNQAISVNSCTTALEIVLRYINVKDAEVIVPTNTFLATANAVLFAGGKPVLADNQKDSYYLDPQEVRKSITPKTKAIIVVHIGGYVHPAIDVIVSICQEKGIALIEDCAHAIGAAYKGKKAGSFGLAGCFSFYPTKIITTGTGGMITTNDEKLAEFAISLRCHGTGNSLSEIVNIGNDWFLDEIRCCLGLNQMENLETLLANRQAVAKFYTDQLKTNNDLALYLVADESFHAYYKFPVQVTKNIDVIALKKDFAGANGFELESLYWPTCHMQPAYQKYFGYKPGMFPVAEEILSRQITLPIHGQMSLEEAEYAYNCVVKAVAARSA